VLVAVVALFACGGDPVTSGDAGIVPAALPTLTPCPPGWREAPLDASPELVRCEPWPESGRAECGLDAAHFAGEPGCRTIGDPCPADGIPAGLPPDASVIFVRAGAAAGGDGTRDAPFSSVTEATASASAGTVIAIAAGRYDEAVELPPAVTLFGACTAETILAAPAATTLDAAVVVTGDGNRVHGLTISGAVRGIVALETAGTLTVDQVVLGDVAGVGVLLHGSARLLGTDVVVRGVTSLAGETITSGIRLDEESAVELDRVMLTGAEAGLWAGGLTGTGGSSVTLRDAVIVGNEGVGAACIGCTLRAERVVLEELRGAAILSHGGDVTVSDAVIRDVRGDPMFGALGRAIFDEGGVVDASRVVIERATEVAVSAGNGTGELRLRDLVIADTQSTDVDRRYGRALVADRSARADIERALIVSNRDVAVAAFGEGTAIHLTDARILTTMERDCASTDCADAPAGIGLGAYTNAAVTMDRFEIGGAALCAVQVARDGSLDLANGQVYDSPIGACVQVDGYDLTRLSGTVAYHDNEANLQATSLPVPEPGTAALP
jgi:hypothetical protein